MQSRETDVLPSTSTVDAFVQSNSKQTLFTTEDPPRHIQTSSRVG